MICHAVVGKVVRTDSLGACARAALGIGLGIGSGSGFGLAHVRILSEHAPELRQHGASRSQMHGHGHGAGGTRRTDRDRAEIETWWPSPVHVGAQRVSLLALQLRLVCSHARAQNLHGTRLVHVLRPLVLAAHLRARARARARRVTGRPRSLDASTRNSSYWRLALMANAEVGLG